MTLQDIPQLEYKDKSYDSNMEGIRRLFGTSPETKFKVETKFVGLIAPRLDGVSEYRNTYFAIKELLLKEIDEYGSSHPFDSRFRQVPAKILCNSNGQIIIITKNGSEIILGGTQNDKSGYIAINQYTEN